MELSNKKVFITGATGFIGGRIAERLWIDHGIKSKCLVRCFSNAARLGRLPVEMIHGDILNTSTIEKAVQDCDIIFHCAYGKTNDPVVNSQINEQGTKHLAEIALKSKTKRFLYLSSVAVYGRHPPERVSEKTPTKLSEDEYGNSKIRTERICRDFFLNGLPVVIIRPTVVFGPFSPIWTIGVIQRVLLGGWEKVEGVDGICNALYIDDLVDSLLLSTRLDKAIGEIFIISGADTLTWDEFFEAHSEISGMPMPKRISGTQKILKCYLSAILRTGLNAARKFADPSIMDLYQRMKDSHPDMTRTFDTLMRGGIKKDEIEKFSWRTIYSIDKASRILGYSPRTFAEGMGVTAEWLRHHQYI